MDAVRTRNVDDSPLWSGCCNARAAQSDATRLQRSGNGWLVRTGAEVERSISDAELAKIELVAYFVPRTHVGQAFILVWVGLRMAAQFIALLPAATVAGALAAFVIAPNDFFSLVDSIQQLTRAEIIAGIPGFRSLLLAMFVVWAALVQFMGYRHGFVNLYAAGREHALRRHLNLKDFEPVELVQTPPLNAAVANSR